MALYILASLTNVCRFTDTTISSAIDLQMLGILVKIFLNPTRYSHVSSKLFQQSSFELNHSFFKYPLHLCGRFAAFSWILSLFLTIFFIYLFPNPTLFIFRKASFTFPTTPPLFSATYQNTSQTFQLMHCLILTSLIRKLHLRFSSCCQIYIMFFTIVD